MRALPRSLWLLAFGTFAIGTDGFVIAGVLPDVADGLGVSLRAAGLLVTGFAIAYALAAPTLAVATAAVDRRPLLTLTLAWFVVANVGAALAPTYSTMMVARLLAAAAAGVFTPTASGVAAQLVSPEMRGRALAIVIGGLTVATALGVPLGTAVAAAAGWRATFWLIAAFGLAAAIGVAWLLPAVPSPPVASLRTRVSVATRPRVLVSLLLTFLVLGGGYTVYSYIAAVLQHTAGAAGTTLSLLLLVWGISAAAGNIASGHLVDRWGPERVLRMSVLVLVGVFAALGAGLVGHVTCVPWLVAWGMAGWMTLPALQHRVAGSAPDLPTVALSLNASALYAGVALGGAFGGTVLGAGAVSDLGIAAGGMEMIALALLGVAAVIASRKASQQPVTGKA